MDTKESQFYFLLVVLVGIGILTFFILRPFLYALVLAVVFATVLQPVYQKILGRMREWPGAAALLTVLLVGMFIVTPLLFLGAQIFREAEQVYTSLANNGGKDALAHGIQSVVGSVRAYVPGMQEFSLDIDQYLKQGLNWLLGHLGGIFSSVAKITLSAFIFLVALYYFLKDGQKVRSSLIALSPFSEANNETILTKIERAVNSVITGNMLVALIQGTLSSIGFAIFGVPSALLWGAVTAIAGLIPGIGTALVLIPAIAFLFLTGELFAAFGLLIWGMLAVGLIDNFLGPMLVGRGMQLHPLLVLLAVLGGVGFFGPIGFLLGPLIVNLLFTLLDIYSSLTKPS